MDDVSEKTIRLDDVSQIASEDPFWAVRGKAIQSYATLEQSLCGVFAFVAGVDKSIAGTIFFNIASAHSLARILERLVQKRYKDNYRLFWTSIVKGFRRISEERNQIVHWMAASTVSGLDSDGRPVVSMSLISPNFWDQISDQPAVTTETLVNFISKCDVYGRACNLFLLHIMGTALRDDMFNCPLIYPLQDGHPLSRSYGASRSTLTSEE